MFEITIEKKTTKSDIYFLLRCAYSFWPNAVVEFDDFFGIINIHDNQKIDSFLNQRIKDNRSSISLEKFFIYKCKESYFMWDNYGRTDEFAGDMIYVCFNGRRIIFHIDSEDTSLESYQITKQIERKINEDDKVEKST